MSYSLRSCLRATAIRRELVVGRPIFGPDSYKDLRGFYNKVQSKDQESVVLIRSAAGSAGGGS